MYHPYLHLDLEAAEGLVLAYVERIKVTGHEVCHFTTTIQRHAVIYGALYEAGHTATHFAWGIQFDSPEKATAYYERVTAGQESNAR